VQSDRRQLGLAADALKAVGDQIGVQRAAVVTGEDQPGAVSTTGEN
jgi:hypothetical protein